MWTVFEITFFFLICDIVFTFVNFRTVQYTYTTLSHLIDIVFPPPWYTFHKPNCHFPEIIILTSSLISPNSRTNTLILFSRGRHPRRLIYIFFPRDVTIHEIRQQGSSPGLGEWWGRGEGRGAPLVSRTHVPHRAMSHLISLVHVECVSALNLASNTHAAALTRRWWKCAKKGKENRANPTRSSEKKRIKRKPEQAREVWSGGASDGRHPHFHQAQGLNLDWWWRAGTRNTPLQQSFVVDSGTHTLSARI